MCLENLKSVYVGDDLVMLADRAQLLLDTCPYGGLAEAPGGSDGGRDRLQAQRGESKRMESTTMIRTGEEDRFFYFD